MLFLLYEDMSRQMMDALRKRMSGGSSASPPTKKSKVREGSSEKRPSREVIDLSEELATANPSTPQSGKSKESGPPTFGSELVRRVPERMQAPSLPMPVLPEVKKGREVMAHHMNRLVPEVGEQLAGADHSSLDMLVGGVLQELTRVSLFFSTLPF